MHNELLPTWIGTEKSTDYTGERKSNNSLLFVYSLYSLLCFSINGKSILFPKIITYEKSICIFSTLLPLIIPRLFYPILRRLLPLSLVLLHTLTASSACHGSTIDLLTQRGDRDTVTPCPAVATTYAPSA